MPFNIPNRSDAPVHERQSILFNSAVDDIVSGIAGAGVISGCGVTASTGMNVSVAAGLVQFTTEITKTVKATTVAVPTANVTNPRIDIIEVAPTGVVSCKVGTAETNPAEPEVTAGYIKLAAIYVPNNLPSVTNNHISDRRVIVRDETSDVYAYTGPTFYPSEDVESLTLAERRAIGYYWPDGSANGFFTRGATTYMIAPNGTYGVKKVSMVNDEPAGSVTPTGSTTGTAIGSAPVGNTWIGGGPIYDTGTDLYMVVHVEKGDYQWNGIAKSTNDGTTWTYIGDVYQPKLAYVSNATWAAAGAGPFVVKNGYMYVFHSQWQTNGFEVNLAVSRCSIANLTTTPVWEAWTGASWVVNGTPDDIFPKTHSRDHRAIHPASYDVSLLPDGRIFMVYGNGDVDGGYPWTTYTTTCYDTDNWLWRDVYPLSSSASERLYATIWSGDPGNPKKMEKGTKLIVTSATSATARWDDATLRIYTLSQALREHIEDSPQVQPTAFYSDISDPTDMVTLNPGFYMVFNAPSVTLPDIYNCEDGQTVSIMNNTPSGAGAADVTVNGGFSQTINGSASYIIKPNMIVRFIAAKTAFDPAAWIAIPEGTPGPGSASMLTIAAPNTPLSQRARADFILTGSTTQASQINSIINAASNALEERFGGIELCQGIFNLEGPILIPARGFTIKGQGMLTELRANGTFATAGRGADKACIKLDTTAKAKAANGITIRDLFINCRGAELPAAAVVPCGGIILDYETTDANTDLASTTTYGQPHAATVGDVYNRIQSVTVVDCRYGISLRGVSASQRGSHIADCIVKNFRYHGFESIDSSDNIFVQCKAIGSYNGADTSYGYNITGGNCRIVGSKAAYVNSSANDVGFRLASSRLTLASCESQDCAIGVDIAGTQAIVDGVRIDTQIDNADANYDTTIGLRVNDTSANVSGVTIHTRGVGDWPIGIDLLNGSAGHRIEAIIEGSVTTPVRYNSANVTDSASLPSGSVYDILVTGIRYLKKTPDISGVIFDTATFTSGSFTPATTSGGWADLFTEPAAGMDLTVPASAGDLLHIGFNAMVSTSANYFDVASIVSAAPVNYLSSGTATPKTEGNPGLYNEGGTGFSTWGSGLIFTVAAGDISGGNVTLRLRYKGAGAGTVYGDTTYPFTWNVRNLG